MTRLSAASLMVCLSLLATATTAHAAKVVLSPLLPDATIDAKQRLGVHQLMSSELEFSPEVDGVVDLPAPPPTLNDSCLANPKCLQGIAASNGGQQVIAGKLGTSGTNFVLDLVFFDGQAIARRKSFTVPQDPTSLANAMTPIVRELLTGAGGGAAAAPASSAGSAATAGAFDLEDDEDFATSKPTPTPVPVATAAPLEDFEAPAPAPSRNGGDRRVAAAAAATGLAVGGLGAAPSPPAAGGVGAGGAPTPDDEALARSLTFGGSVQDISAEELNAISFSAPPGVSSAPAPAPRPAPRAVADADLEIEGEELEEDDDGSASLDDLDNPRSRPSSGRSGGSSGGSSDEGIAQMFQLTVRGGYSKYYRFNFATFGGEVAFGVTEGLFLVAGMEMYAVQRVLPPELQLETGIYSQWNYIFPGNLGAVYKLPLGIVQPYVGADTIFVQYYKDEIGADWAIGARFRTGADFMVHRNFGFNVNLAAGAWSGQNWSLIEQGVGRAGFLPQVSAGTLVAF
jgi:hypothetical protein